jgi:hypothetical protein
MPHSRHYCRHSSPPPFSFHTIDYFHFITIIDAITLIATLSIFDIFHAITFIDIHYAIIDTMTLLIDAIALAIDIDIANIDISMIFLSPVIDAILLPCCHFFDYAITLLFSPHYYYAITPLRH